MSSGGDCTHSVLFGYKHCLLSPRQLKTQVSEATILALLVLEDARPAMYDPFF